LVFDNLPVLVSSHEEGYFEIIVTSYRMGQLKTFQVWDLVDVVA
jgi:hypothetical protein